MLIILSKHSRNHLSPGPCLPLYWNETKKWEVGRSQWMCISITGGDSRVPPTLDLLSLRFKLGICIVNELLYRLNCIFRIQRILYHDLRGESTILKSFMVVHICQKSHWELLLSNWISQNSVRMMEFLGNRDHTPVPKDEMGW